MRNRILKLLKTQRARWAEGWISREWQGVEFFQQLDALIQAVDQELKR